MKFLRQRRSKRSRESGFILSIEFVLITTIIATGLVIGMVAIRDSVAAELKDLVDAWDVIKNNITFQDWRIVINGMSYSVPGDFSPVSAEAEGPGPDPPSNFGIWAYDAPAAAE